MPNITLKNIPVSLHRHLKKRAMQHRRSLNSEVIACLEASIEGAFIQPDQLLKKARSIRKGISGQLTDRRLRTLRDSGRK